MNRQIRADQAFEEWLADGPTRMPSHLVDSIVTQLEETHQRKHLWLPGREQMNRIMVAVGGVAAIALIAVLGFYFLGRGNAGIGGVATPAPTASPTPTASPAPTPTASPTANGSPVAGLPAWYTTSETPTGLGILPPGSHTTQRFSPGFTFNVPEGWVNDTDSADFFGLFPDTPANQAEFARSESLAHSFVMAVFPTPYFTCQSLESNRGAAAAEMVASASANEVLAVSEPVDVSIGGLTGKQIDVRRSPEWTGNCPEDSTLPAGIDPEDERSRGIFLDVPGRGVLVMLLYSSSSAEHEAFLADLMPIIKSFQFSQ